MKNKEKPKGKRLKQPVPQPVQRQPNYDYSYDQLVCCHGNHPSRCLRCRQGKRKIIMRVIDIFFAFPPIVLAIFLMATLGPSLLNVVLVVAMVTIPQFTRIARSVAISERNQDYVLAARVLGASTPFVLRRHLLVNAIPPLAVQVTVLLADAILIEASLSFLGIGVRPPTPTWGGILSAGRDYVFTGFWWFTVFPGLAIFLAVFSLNVLGDGLRDFIDPTTRPRGSGE